MNKDNDEIKYTNSVFYEIVLTGKYLKKTAELVFKRLEIILTNEEFVVLDILYKNNAQICHRDLALKMFADRANMGKILKGLENKNYVKIEIGTRQNRPIKMVTLIQKGESTYLDTVSKLRETTKTAMDEITREECDRISSSLKKMRKTLSEIIDTNI